VHKRGHEKIALHKKEAEKVVKVSELAGTDPDQAAEALVHDAFARRMRRGTGKGPARVQKILPGGSTKS